MQNTVAESIATLPTAVVLASLLWWLPQGGYSNTALAALMIYGAVTLLLIKAVSDNTLLRIQSQMIPALYLTLLAVCGFLHQLQPGSIATLCLAGIVACLFSTYENRRSATASLHTGLLLSLGSLAMPPLLLLYPVVLMCQAIFMRSLSWKTFAAGWTGLLLPYWFWTAIALLQSDFTPLCVQWFAITDPVRTPLLALQHSEPVAAAFWQHAAETLYSGANPGSLDYTKLNAHPLSMIPMATSALVVGLLGLTGYIHYRNTSYDDKIRVRMCYYTFLTLQAVLTLWLLLQPRQYHHLFPLLLFVTTPPAAHFFAQTGSKATNAWFIVCIFLLILMAAATLVIPLICH